RIVAGTPAFGAAATRGAAAARETPIRRGALGAPWRASIAGSTGAGDCVLEPPRLKTWICDAWVPPPEDVTVPPTPIAMYSVPFAWETDGPSAIWKPVWNVQRILQLLTSNARKTPSPPPKKPTPPAVVVGPPRSGCGVFVLQTRWPVETSIALSEP